MTRWEVLLENFDICRFSICLTRVCSTLTAAEEPKGGEGRDPGECGPVPADGPGGAAGNPTSEAGSVQAAGVRPAARVPGGDALLPAEDQPVHGQRPPAVGRARDTCVRRRPPPPQSGRSSSPAPQTPAHVHLRLHTHHGPSVEALAPVTPPESPQATGCKYVFQCTASAPLYSHLIDFFSLFDTSGVNRENTSELIFCCCCYFFSMNDFCKYSQRDAEANITLCC